MAEYEAAVRNIAKGADAVREAFAFVVSRGVTAEAR